MEAFRFKEYNLGLLCAFLVSNLDSTDTAAGLYAEIGVLLPWVPVEHEQATSADNRGGQLGQLCLRLSGFTATHLRLFSCP